MKVPVRMFKMSGGGQYDVPEEGDVVAWLKDKGDRVVQGEGLCEFEADKGTMIIVAPISGTLVDIAYPIEKKTWIRGEAVLPLGDPIFYDPPFCWIETDEFMVAHVLPKSQSDHVLPEQDRRAPVIVTHNEPRKKRSRMFVGPFQSAEEARKAKPRMSAGALRLVQKEKISNEELFDFFGGNVGIFTEYHIKRLLEKRDADAPLQHGIAVTHDMLPHTTIKAVPLARVIAREQKIDLMYVQGTGPDGLILASDVENNVIRQEVHQKVRADQPMAQESEEPILLSMPRLWRTIAKNMEAGIRIPTVDARTDSRRFNIRRLTELYGNSRQSFKKVWLPLMVAYARVLGNERFAIFNSYWHEETDSEGNITPYVAVRKHVHMGIAYDRGELPIIDWNNKTIRGERLRILVVCNAHLLSLKDIMSEVERLFEAAEQKRLSLQDTSGYTAIFNNLGVLRHHSGRSILTQGIASMLNLGLVDMESGEAVVQSVVDHRLIDGAKTAPFFIALYKELIHRVLPELEALLSEKK